MNWRKRKMSDIARKRFYICLFWSWPGNRTNISEENQRDFLPCLRVDQSPVEYFLRARARTYLLALGCDGKPWRKKKKTFYDHMAEAIWETCRGETCRHVGRGRGQIRCIIGDVRVAYSAIRLIWHISSSFTLYLHSFAVFFFSG